jgi:tripartite-type tricarboxylate transporter receptor subunit TctC
MHAKLIGMGFAGCRLAAAIVLLALSGVAAEAGSVGKYRGYPSRPVHWVVPYTPGGATDVLARLLGQRLSERLEQQFVIENKPGAGSNIGTEAVVSAPADGYTLLLVSTANAINASLYARLPFNFARDIAPVAGLVRIPLVMEVTPSLPVMTVAEFIAYAKAHPGAISAASSGIGTSLHLSGELFAAMAGVTFVHVPYRGSAPAITDLIAGQVQVMFDNVSSSAGQIRAGKLRALGVTTRLRSDILPEVPPIADTVAGYEASSFYGVGAPRGTPPDVIALLNEEFNAALEDPAIRPRLTELGMMPVAGSPADFAAFIAGEIDKWATVVRQAGIATQ